MRLHNYQNQKCGFTLSFGFCHSIFACVQTYRASLKFEKSLISVVDERATNGFADHNRKEDDILDDRS